MVPICYEANVSYSVLNCNVKYIKLVTSGLEKYDIMDMDYRIVGMLKHALHCFVSTPL